jgi:hypothetical protein
VVRKLTRPWLLGAAVLVGLVCVTLVAFWHGTPRAPTARTPESKSEPGLAHPSAAPSEDVAAPVGLLVLRVLVRHQQAPVPGAKVVLAGPGMAKLSLRTTSTGPDGAARFADLGAGEYGLQVTHPEFPVATRSIQLQAAPLDVEVVLERGAMVFGVVLDGSGLPVAGAELRVSHAGSVDELRLATTPKDGTFTLAGLPLGELVLGVRARQFRPQHVDLHLQRDGERHKETIRLELGRSVTGRVVTRQGDPVAGAHVGSSDDSGTLVTTGEGGEFELDGLGDKPVNLYVTKSGFATTHRPGVVPGTRDLGLVLELPATISGELSLPPQIGRIDLSLCHYDDTFRRELCVARRVLTPPVARYELSDLPAGTYDLVAEAEGFPPLRRPVKLAPGEQVAGPRLGWPEAR